ncbi:MAG: hypothetical protein EA351_12650 [Gemmatimonadales bacterium]|nr:MAG: hypothetical protein EA351_12650 [Gemmatimonadales bacterium]
MTMPTSRPPCPTRPGLAHTTLGALLALVVVAGCSDSPSAPGPDDIEFSVSQITLDGLGEATLVLRNRGAAPVGPVEFISTPVRAGSGSGIPGAEIRVTPDQLPTLPGGTDREVTLRLHPGDGLGVGRYTSTIEARGGSGERLATLEVDFRLACPSDRPPAASFEIRPPVGDIRRGDVVALEVDALDSDGNAIAEPCVTWTIGGSGQGLVTSDARFVAYSTGTIEIAGESGDARQTITLEIAPRGVGGEQFTLVGEGRLTEQHTSDLWLWEDIAYTGTWGQRSGPEGLRFGNSLHAWDISDPEAPVRTHTVQVDARTVNDVKIRDDGQIAVMTHENSNDGLNGITLLDLTDPTRPEPITRFTDGLQAGIHNVWIEGDHVYLVVNGTGNGLRVLDISVPADPQVVASFYGGSSFLHDVYVRDGLAFLSHWDAGLIILDVGHGMAGGAPDNPVEVGRTTTTGGRTHNAWYWPETGYVFVGEENFARPGIMHVIDARDLTNPKEVATFEVPGQTPHNFWLDEDRGILYLAWYGQGLRALDVTGELLGALDRQGREIAEGMYGDRRTSGLCTGAPTVTCTWAPQLHRGLVFVSDLNSGLRVLRPEF